MDDVSTDPAAGEVHGLVDEDGASKFTRIQVLAGAVRADRGEVVLNGAPLALESVRDALRHGMAFIRQELNLVNPYLQNVLIGSLLFWPCWFRSWRGGSRMRVARLLRVGYVEPE